MGDRSTKSKRRKKQLDESSSPASSSSSYSSHSSSSSEGIETSSKRLRKRSHKHHKDERRQRRDKEKRRERRRRRDKRDKDRRHSKRRNSKRNFTDSESEFDKLETDMRSADDPVNIVRLILKNFPGVADDLEQLLKMIDNGQAVDIRGLSERSLIKHLRKLFISLNLEENSTQVFFLPSNVLPTLEVVGPIIHMSADMQSEHLDPSVSQNDMHLGQPDAEHVEETYNANLTMPYSKEDIPKRMIGPEVPSAELLAAAAKLTEAEAELRQVEEEEGDVLFIGPPPPALVTEVESANDAERFEEVTRIMGAEVDSPYDILGVNHKMSAENMKKRYWKLSLMVHPDKCSHPQAHQAFIILNKAFKDVQDPDKRKAMDEKIKLKEEQEQFKVELKAMREAAQWRQLQGISMEGDDVLLADTEVQVEPKRDEWMTTLPAERKPGMTMQSTKFSRTFKEGRGDTSAWTDTPSERAEKAKMNYLEAFNEASALASNVQVNNKRTNKDAELVDNYNKTKRSKSLVEKHQEGFRNHSKKKSKQEPSKEEWEGKHPWKPWDREKDLTAGRQSVKLDAENMSQGLSSRFSSGSYQRNFL